MKLRKIATSLLCGCMALGVLLSVNSMDTYAKSKSAVYSTFNNGTLTIRGKGKMPEKMAFGCKKLEKITIPNTVREIGEDAFGRCENLQSVKLNNGLKKIDDGAFAGCRKLKKVTIPKMVTEIGDSAFCGCENLQSVKLYAGLISIDSYAFGGCKKLKKITIPKTVTKLAADTFNGSNKLKYLKMPGNCRVYWGDAYPKRIDTIEFSTDLDLEITHLMEANNFIVSEEDKNYSSFDGIIYTKDGKETMRLPSREKVVIREGCTRFNIKSILFYVYLEDYGEDEEEWYIPHKMLKEIVLPKSVNYLVTGGSDVKDEFSSIGRHLDKITIKNNNMDINVIIAFIAEFPFRYDIKTNELLRDDESDFWKQYDISVGC